MEVSTKEIDKLYKEWKGNSHLDDSNRQIFDSSDCTEFAKFVLEHAIKNYGFLHNVSGFSQDTGDGWVTCLQCGNNNHKDRMDNYR